ncbi:MAG: hypothetical protein AAGA54_00825 [Myxococcota bacterium]
MRHNCAAYLDGLPNGFDSFPEAQGLFDAFTPMLARLDLDAVDARLRQALEAQERRRAPWVPEALNTAIVLATADDAADDDVFLASVLDRNLELYKRPVYRALMFVLSPTLALMGAPRRWSAFHRGTTLDVGAWKPVGDRNTATLRLEHPAGLFPPLIHRAYAEAFRAAGVVTRADDVTIACDSTASSATFEVSYRR